MSAVPLIVELRRAGIVLSAVGDRLHVEAPIGVVTPVLRQRIAENKAGLMAELKLEPDAVVEPKMREALLVLAERHGINTTSVHRLRDLDVVACVGLDNAQLVAYLEMLDDTATRWTGRVPTGHTEPMYCHRCGPVWIHPSIAACLPVVNGWPRALGCPWCAVRRAGVPIPRPPARHMS